MYTSKVKPAYNPPEFTSLFEEEDWVAVGVALELVLVVFAGSVVGVALVVGVAEEVGAGSDVGSGATLLTAAGVEVAAAEDLAEVVGAGVEDATSVVSSSSQSSSFHSRNNSRRSLTYSSPSSTLNRRPPLSLASKNPLSSQPLTHQ